MFARAWVLAVLGMFLAPDQATFAAPVTIRDLAGLYSDLNEICRGGSGDHPETMQACDVREKVGTLIKALGYCSGGPTGWRRC